nr:Chain C, T3SS secreted effector NleH homolog [Escherichia coli O127:H6 str. E2348/69]7TZK_D Chain D, T3SS secreted effector NleH homolog [Escherichia coli O127:H6 str. E2348/69]
PPELPSVDYNSL